MDLNEIKQILEIAGSVVVFDQDGSRLVVLSYNKYLELFSKSKEETKVKLKLFSPSFKNGLSDQEMVERLNQDIAILKDEIKKKELQEIDLAEEDTVID